MLWKYVNDTLDLENNHCLSKERLGVTFDILSESEERKLNFLDVCRMNSKTLIET